MAPHRGRTFMNMKLPFISAALLSLLRSALLSLIAFIRAPLTFASPCSHRFPSAQQQPLSGTVFHSRWYPIIHSFKTRVTYALVHLCDQSPQWAHDIALDEQTVRTLASEVDMRALYCDDVMLLAVPPAGGVNQNPIKVYYCLVGNEAVGCVAEVTNTPWGERTAVAFKPPADSSPKPLHVSPFNCTEKESWRICTSRYPLCGETLSVSVVVSRHGWGAYLAADLHLERLSTEKVERRAIGSPQKISLLIYLNAALLWLRGLHTPSHPKYRDIDDGQAFHSRVLQRARIAGAFMWMSATEDPWTRTKMS